MSVTAIAGLPDEAPALRISIPVPRFLRTLGRRIVMRRMMARLARLPPRLIRDAGFDPDVVRDAVAGTWDEIGPGRYRDR